MTTCTTRSQGHSPYELRFRPLFDARRGYSSPCDASGVVDIDWLSERVRSTYFIARTVVGREVAMPEVQLRDPDPRECQH